MIWFAMSAFATLTDILDHAPSWLLAFNAATAGGWAVDVIRDAREARR